MLRLRGSIEDEEVPVWKPGGNMASRIKAQCLLPQSSGYGRYT